VALLSIDSVVAGYDADLDILRGTTAEVNAGEIVTLIGPNGAGKSTLLKAVIGLLRPRVGSIVLDGEDIAGMAPHRIVGRGISYVPQRGHVFPTMSVEENLTIALFGKFKQAGGERLAEVYTFFPILSERRRQIAGSLSGGERVMVAVARALLTMPRILVLDEPSGGLSPRMVDVVFGKVIEINAAGTTILMVEQNARRALSFSHRAYVLDGGRTALEGRGEELLHDPRVVDLYLGRGGGGL
jgi:ABC-type branched-subunit amino acid transport system ATPase component